MKLEKVEKILKMSQLLNENPDISAKELADRLNINLRNVYYHLKQFQEIGIPTGLGEKGQHVVYDEVDHVNLAFSQPQLLLIYNALEEKLQNSQGLNESEIHTLEQAKELISKALLVRPEPSSASISFLSEPTKGKYEGEVSIGFVGNLEASNPLHIVNLINVHLLSLIFSSLFSYPKGKPLGLLVKSWEVSDDLLAWTFELKDGVKFHNGKELTAEDVAFTYQCIADPGFGSPLASTYSFARSFEAVSKYKFQIKLKSPYIELLERLGIPILPKEVLQRYRRLRQIKQQGRQGTRSKKLKPIEPKDLLIGSGPFKFDSLPQANTMILKANEDYFEEGYPHLEKVILKAYPTSRDLFNTATSGEVDVVMFGLSVAELEQLGKSQPIPFQVYPVDMHAYYALLFNMKDEILSDIKVRKAINCAIDRESLISRQLRGYGNIATGPLPISSWAYNKGLQPVEHDINLAKALLAEAGWVEMENHWQKRNEKLGIEITVAKEIPDLSRLAVGLRMQLSKFKVKVKLTYISLSELAPGAFQSMLLPINCGGDQGNVLWKFWHSKSGMNFSLYQNSEVDDLLDWGKSVISISRRKAIYDRAQELIVADHPAAFLCTWVYLIGSNYTLQNAEEFLTIPGLFSSIKVWSIKRAQKGDMQ